MYIALGIIVIYLLYVFIRYKCVPKSISDTFYLGTKWAFTAVMWAVGFCVAPELIEITPINYKVIPFILSFGILLVGAAPHFKEDAEKGTHIAGACIFGFCSQLWAALYGSPWLLLAWVGLLPFIKSKQRTFWIEILCIITLFIAYLL